MKIATVEQMRAIEEQTDAAGISYDQMMESAGHGVSQAISGWLDINHRKVVVLVGPGNNGGDGLVAGRYLAQEGAKVTLYLYKKRPEDDLNMAQVEEMGLPIVWADDDKNGETLRELVRDADVIVDALLGTGTALPIRGGLGKLLEWVKAAVDENRRLRRSQQMDLQGPVSPAEHLEIENGLPLIVAVDCPSGLDCDSGQLDPKAIPADLTVTFAAPKAGQFIFPGAKAIGDLLIADIGCPPELPALQEITLELATAASVRSSLPSRPLDAHKGTFGKVMIVAGSVNYVGAAALAAEAAYRTGVGLVTLAVPSAIHLALAAHLTEPTYVLLPHAMGVINEHGVDLLLESLDGYAGLLVGPGLGRDEKTRMFLERLLMQKRQSSRGPIGFVRESGKQDKPRDDSLPPMVIDADALNLLSEMENWARLLPPHCILTPHPGEMSRLSGQETADIQADRTGIARQAAADWDQIVLLKGAFTVIAEPDGRATVIPFANPALSTAGTGDVLAGIIVSLLGQGMAPYEAAVAGAFIHGAAGEMASHMIGKAGTMAGDLLPAVGAILEDWGL